MRKTLYCLQSSLNIRNKAESHATKYKENMISINGKNYKEISLLGHGKGGYSYLVTDGEWKYVLKQIHHEPCSYYQFGNKLQAELTDYKRLLQVGINMPRMLDVDVEHERILKQYIEGENIFDLILRDGIDKETLEEAMEQVRRMCDVLYPANLNIDFFPTNFVLNRGTLYYVDYECNDYSEEWNFQNWGVKYWSKTADFLRYAKSLAVRG